MTDRPNILCLVAEDCPPRLGPYGDPLAVTPNIDRLAEQGVVYDNAFCTSPVCAPSRFAIVTGRHAESCGPAEHMTAPTAHWPSELGTYPEMMRGAGYYCSNNTKTHYNCDIVPEEIWDETNAEAHWRNRPAGTPFVAVFNLMLTHESCVFSDMDGPVAPGDVTLPAYLPDTAGTRLTLARYYNRIAAMDRWIGERLAELDAAGVAEDTVVLFHADHGSPLPRSKRFCYDEGLQVPLIVRVPQRWRGLSVRPPGSRVADPLSLVDLMPTLAAVAGLEPPAGLHGQPFLGAVARARSYAFSGRGRMDERYDMVRTARSARYRYIRNYAPHLPWSQHYGFAWLSEAYRDYERLHLAGALDPVQDRFFQPKPAEELYDIAADPEQVRNLADDPAHGGTLEEMRAALDAHLLAVNDNGFIPEGMAPQGWAESRAPDAYPLAEIMAVAARAIRRDPAETAGFTAGLAHSHPVARYWAAQGLLMLAAAGHVLPGVSEAFAAEGEPRVRVVLAEAAGRVGAPEGPVRYLTKIAAGPDDPRLRLMALNALARLPLDPGASLDFVKAAAMDDDEYVRGAAEHLRLRLTGAYLPEVRVFRAGMPMNHGHTGMDARRLAPTPDG